MSQLTEFKKELKELLTKYDAYIGFSVSDCSDTYGLSDEKMIVSFKKNKESFERKDHTLTYGWCISSSDLK